MSNKKWLNFSEYLLVAGSGVGTVASIASQQLAFAAAPLSFLFLLNLINRRQDDRTIADQASAEVAQLDERFSSSLSLLDQQLRTLPTFIDLSSQRKTILQRNDAAIAQLQQNFSYRISALEEKNVDRLERELAQLQTKYSQLTESIGTITNYMSRLATNHRVAESETTIAALKDEITQLQVRLTEVASAQKQGIPRALQDELHMIHRRLNALPQPFDATALKQDVDGLVKVVGEMVSRRELAKLMTEVEKIRQNQKTLEQTVAPMKAVNTIMRKQMDTLSSWVTAKGNPAQMAELEALKGTIAALEQHLRSHAQSEYELVFNLKSAQGQSEIDALSSSRVLLIETLRTAQDRVIVVFPYPDRTTFDDELIQEFEAFLNRGGDLDIGWGHLRDVQSSQQIRYILDRHTPATEKKFLTTVLNQLTQLKRNYPEQFRFKVLGTDENFLVCDTTHAILGIHPVLTNSVTFPEVAIGLKTTNTEVIQGLINRFDHPVLAENDLEGYYNRAVTRYELGDRQGAIADLTDVIRIDPNHAIAYNDRALIRLEAGNKEAAIIDFNRAVLSDSRNCVVYCNRGVLRSQMQDQAGAIEDFSYAIHVNPDCSQAYYQRGLARLKLGKKQGALEDFTAMIRIAPQDPVGYFNRGLVRSKMGDKTTAIRDFKEAAWLFSSQGDTAKYQHAIDAISKLRQRHAEPGAQKVIVLHETPQSAFF
jgi:tetratricopeptide (TPR) repeat protein